MVAQVNNGYVQHGGRTGGSQTRARYVTLQLREAWPAAAQLLAMHFRAVGIDDIIPHTSEGISGDMPLRPPW